MKKITFKDVLEDRNNSDNKCSYFKHYCYLNDCCDKCDKKIRFICKFKNKLENIQNKIIEKM